ncbi:MAG: PQQ-like beta-propeller repeat protein, partial [Planctomycetia bacterium]|nr:PQQ-like beta-propeller repeat protein [Planctomycetia bacterium]
CVGDKHKLLQAVCVDAASGKLVWRLPSEHPLAGAPAFAAGRVYFTWGNGKLDREVQPARGGIWCVDAARGEKVWAYDAKGSVLSSPVMAEDSVCFSCRDGHVYCLDARSGQSRWRLNLSDSVVASPAVADGRLYAVTVSGRVVCLNVRDGVIWWEYKGLPAPDRDVYAGPVLEGGKLIVAAGGKLYCLGDHPERGLRDPHRDAPGHLSLR